MVTIRALFLLLSLGAATVITGVSGLCHRRECNCTAARTGGKASTCFFTKRQVLEMSGSDFPTDLSSVEMTGGRELRFGTEVFSKLHLLEFVRIAMVSKVYVREHTFANMSSTRKVRFEFEEGSSLILEGSSWKNVLSSIMVTITRFGQVIIQAKAFSCLSDITVKQVAKLELLENAFWNEMPRQNPRFTIKSIVLDQVKLENLASGTFYSLATNVRIKDSQIQRVKRDAFIAISIDHVTIENTTLNRVEAGSFSDRTILQTLKLDRVTLNELESGAVVSGITHLHIHQSRFGVIHSGGFNVTLASASINHNVFNRIHSRGLTLKQWDSLSINNNAFKKLDPEAFSSLGQIKKIPPGINFTRNNLYDVPSNAFDFEVNEELNPFIDNNFFHFKCHCDMFKSVLVIVRPPPLNVTLFQTGLCIVDHLLSKCYEIPEGFVNMVNFTEEKCMSDKIIVCEEVQRDAEIPPLPGITSSVDISFPEDFEQEKRILGSLFIIFVCGMIIMMVLPTIMWVGRNGYCNKARIFLLPSTNSFINYLTRLFSGSGMTPTGSAHSISRIDTHEYAELQRKIGEMKEEEEDIPLEDKATQTLPEELTQELLQTLQEKLNDPENYSEARNMIEHLYDLIKVEESCNKNYKESPSINLDDLDKENENLYDVIVPARKMSSNNNRTKAEMRSIGTRAPSPDKLLPYSVYGETRKLRPAISDYMEPKDRQVHTYTELPNRTAGPGQSSVVCDYREPTDTRIHMYTELPVGNNIKMANRPLPSKPIVDGESVS